MAVRPYHEHGYVHLDLKPANMLILPETKDQILLIDFDTVHSIDELHAETAPFLCFSNNYSAPELRLGYAKKISPATDIYSIGAIAYKKITGCDLDREHTSPQQRYSFAELKQGHPDFPPLFWQKLTSFLKRTLAPSRHSRYQEIAGPFLEDLDQLIELSRPDQTVLISNFAYHNDYFLGREGELDQIERVLQEHNALFLHGMGGIGKSELARQYAWSHQAEYDTILFLSCKAKLKETLADDEGLGITHFQQGNDEATEAYYRRKLSKLKEVCHKRCLIILDNLADEDLQLEEILSCPAQFIITSRLDMTDWNYVQIEVGPLPTLQEQLALFKKYNPLAYGDAEQKTIADLISFVDGHTMTIELLAKQLRMSRMAPSLLAERFLASEGISNAAVTSVRHRKDCSLNKGSVFHHLHMLFTLSGFSEKERIALEVLLLLGGIHMEQSTFCQWCHISPETIRHLLNRGWIKTDDKDKLYLHQIILDLAYTVLSPNATDLQHVLAHVNNRVSKSFSTAYERRIYMRICQTIFQRLNGTTARLIRLYWLFCQYIRKDEQHKAGSVCLNHITLDMQIEDEDISAQFAFMAEKFWSDALLRLDNLPGTVITHDLKKEVLAALAELYDPDNFALGLVSDAIGDTTKKFACQEQLSQLEESESSALHLHTSQAYTDAGDYYLGRGEYGKAIGHYQKGLHSGECAEFILPRLGEAQERSGQLEPALSTYEQLLALDQTHGPLVPISADYLNLYRIEAALHHQEKARDYVQRYLNSAAEEAEADPSPYRLNQLGRSLLVAREINYGRGDVDTTIDKLCTTHLDSLLQERTSLDLLQHYVRLLADQHRWRELAATLQHMSTLWLNEHPAITDEEFHKLVFIIEQSLPVVRTHMPAVKDECLYWLACLYKNQGEASCEATPLLHRARDLYEQAYALACQNRGEQALLAMQITGQLVELFEALHDDSHAVLCRNRCNYFALAQAQAETATYEQAAQAWLQAAASYKACQKYDAADRCYHALADQGLPDCTQENSCKLYLDGLIAALANASAAGNEQVAHTYAMSFQTSLLRLITEYRPAWCDLCLTRNYYAKGTRTSLPTLAESAITCLLFSLWLTTMAGATLPDVTSIMEFSDFSPLDKMKRIVSCLQSPDEIRNGDEILSLTEQLKEYCQESLYDDIIEGCSTIEQLIEQNVFYFPPIPEIAKKHP